MAHWAEIDENNTVVRVLVAGDDSHDWLVERLGGTWLQTSYNTKAGEHTLGGTPFRGNYAGVGYTYDETLDAFITPKPNVDLADGSGIVDYEIDPTTYSWIPVYEIIEES